MSNNFTGPVSLRCGKFPKQKTLGFGVLQIFGSVILGLGIAGVLLIFPAPLWLKMVLIAFMAEIFIGLVVQVQGEPFAQIVIRAVKFDYSLRKKTNVTATRSFGTVTDSGGQNV